MATMIKRLMSQSVTLRINGEPKKVPYGEAFIHKLIAKSLDGRPTDMIALLKAIKVYFPEATEPERVDELRVTFVRPKDPKQFADPKDSGGGGDPAS